MATYEAPLGTRITYDTRKRLRDTAYVRGQSISAVLTDLLDRELPSAEALAADLAAQIANGKERADVH